MKKVKATTIPTIKQMSNMAFNLREKFKVHSDIQINCQTYSSGSSNIEYKLYIARTENEYFDNWKTLQGYYFNLMKG